MPSIDLAFQRLSCSPGQIVELLLPRVTEHRRKRLLEVVNERTLSILPVLENIYDRGNVSAVMRSAEAFGFFDFHLIERPDGAFKVANRVTKGTDKWLNINRYESTDTCFKLLKKRGVKIYATHLSATHSIEEVDFTEPSAVVFGNEKNGVSDRAIELCDKLVILPMFGFAESFNISVAAALCFYRIHLQRREKLGSCGDLTEKQKEEVLAWYLLKTVDHSEEIIARLGCEKK